MAHSPGSASDPTPDTFREHHRKSRGVVVTVVLAVALKACLDFAYLNVVQPNWGYMGLVLTPNTTKIIESYFLVAIFGLLLGLCPARPSKTLLSLLLAVTIVPILSYYGYADRSREFLYLMLMGAFIVGVMSLVPLPKPPRVENGVAIGIIVAIVAVVGCIAFLIGSGAMSGFSIQFGDYESRAVQNLLLGDSGPWAYIVGWTAAGFNPALLCWALFRRHRILVVTTLAVQFFLFGITTQKSFLFFGGLVLLVYLTKWIRRPHIALLGAVVAATLAGILLSTMFGSTGLTSLVTRRVEFVPAKLDFAYYEVFSERGFVRLTNTNLGLFTGGPTAYPFNEQPPLLVSRYAYRNDMVGPGAETLPFANTGFIATSFMHFGAGGVIAFSIIVGLLLALTNSLGAGRLPDWLVTAVVVAPFFDLFSGADLGAALLTHGLITALAMLWLFSSYEEDPQESEAPVAYFAEPSELRSSLATRNV